jgi:CubicO group peptidase (beta-lactamase class C family)
MINYLKAFILCFFFLVLCPVLVLARQQSLPPDLDTYIQQVLKTFEVPGVSVAIVKEGKVLFTKGYGLRKIGDPSPVNDSTLFSIASNSKAFTASALAILVGEGKLKWEDKVVKYLPWFKLHDNYVTEHLTIRDLLVHHSGLPAYANDMLLFPPSTFTRKELLQKLKDVPLQHDFRSVYAYDNILYLAAGEVIETVSGMLWEDFVKQRIFDVVGMKHSISRFSTLKQQENVAYSHVKRNGQLKVIDNFFEQNIGDAGNPAGGIASSAADMAKWVLTQLDSGRTPSGAELFKPAATEELWKIVRPMPITKEPSWLAPNQKRFYGYALGFRTYDYRGQQVIGHGGLLTGFVSQIAMVPQLKLGIAVLTNQLSSGAYWAIINHILDYYMHAPTFDWIAGYKKEADRSVAKQDSVERQKKNLIPDPNLKRSLPLSAYAGVYQDHLLGTVNILEQADTLRIRFLKSPQLNATLAHFHGDLFKLNYLNTSRGAGPMLSFALNPDKTVREANFISTFTDADSDWENIVLKPDQEAVIDTTMLREKVLAAFAKQPAGTFAAAFRAIGNDETFMFNEHQLFHAASTMKTPVLAEVFKQAEKGKFSISDSVKVYNEFKSIYDKSLYTLKPANDSEQDLYSRTGAKVTMEDLLYRMITQSSNLATNIMIDLVGAKNVMKTMRSIGANDIKVLRGVEDSKAFEHEMNNMVTAYDLMLLFDQIARGKMISKKASDDMVAILSKQHFRGIIPAGLPSDVKVANKTGSINKVNHDSGIVYLPDGRKYVLILLSKGVEEAAAKQTLSAVSTYIYRYMMSQ